VTTVTFDMLVKAIENSIMEEKGLCEEEVREIAQKVLDFFGFENTIIDNVLRPKERDLFYMLEGAGILKTQEEETKIPGGKAWRIHYWVLNMERIIELGKPKEEEDLEKKVSSIYEEMDDDVWKDHK